MYQTEAFATTIDIKTIDNQKCLVLDQTLFFPEGGGQPGDQGTVNDTKVIDLKSKDGQVLHQINNNSFEIRDTVKLKINWDHRYKYMKIHSAGHLLHEVIMEINDSLIPLKGNHRDDAYLVYSGHLDINLIPQIDTRLQQLVSQDLPILCDYTDIDTLQKDARSVPDNLPKHKKLRRLKIGSYPSMADGGIQVKSTREIGQVKITSIENNQNQVKISYTVL